MSGPLKIVVANVGQGDANVIFAPNGKVAVIDCYDGPKIAALLSDCGKTTIDLLVTTHPHYDHIKGIPHLLQKFRVKVWWDTKAPCPSRSYVLTNRLCRDKDITAMYVGGAGNSTDLGVDDLSIKVLSPSAVQRNGIDKEVAANGQSLPPNRSFNDYSIVIGVRYHNFHMVLGADAEMATWSALQVEQEHEMRCNVLKLPHHGSNRGAHFQLLDAMAPQHIIISYGAGNVHGHPTQLTRKTLKEYVRTARQKIRIWRTANDGSILVTSNGSSKPIVQSNREAPKQAIHKLL